MTDYLALALEQDEEEREELAPALEPGPGLPYPRDREEVAGEGLPQTLSPAPALPREPAVSRRETRAQETGVGRKQEEEPESERAEETAETTEEAVEEMGRKSPEETSKFPTAAPEGEAEIAPSLRFAGEAPSTRFAGKPRALPTEEGAAPSPRPGGKAPARAGQWEERQVLNALEKALDLAVPRTSRALPTAGGVRDASARDFPVMDAGERETAALDLLTQVRQAQRRSGFVQSQRRAFTVTLPESESPAPAWSAEEFDRSCERDARRYGGGFGLY